MEPRRLGVCNTVLVTDHDSRSRVQFKADGEINLLPEGSEVLYRYQELVDGDTSWELVAVKTPS
jgi:hypothetical protein